MSAARAIVDAALSKAEMPNELSLQQRVELLRLVFDYSPDQEIVFVDRDRHAAYHQLYLAIQTIGPWPKATYKGICWTCFVDVNDMPHSDDCGGVAIRDALARLGSGDGAGGAG